MNDHFDQVFKGWIAKYDEDQSVNECSRSYYDSDTGLTDYEQARFDDMREAFAAGIIYAQSLAKAKEPLLNK